MVFAVLFPPVMVLLFWNLPLQYRMARAVFNGYNRFLTRIYLPLLGVYRITEERGFDRYPPGKPAIFVANHRSRMDGPFIIPLLPEIGVIIKSSYARMPFYRGLVKYLNFISVDPRSMDSLGDAMRQCRELLAQGKRILIFPEGTRAGGARLNVFKDMAFRLSIDTGVPIVPCIVHTDVPFMAKINGSYFPGRTFSIVLRALGAEYGLANERASAFADRVRQRMAEEIRTLDAGTPWEQLPASHHRDIRPRHAAGIVRTETTHPATAPVQEKQQ
jgi:1-acyl-sn-glycerol-3-phosphate acyltransferase